MYTHFIQWEKKMKKGITVGKVNRGVEGNVNNVEGIEIKMLSLKWETKEDGWGGWERRENGNEA